MGSPTENTLEMGPEDTLTSGADRGPEPGALLVFSAGRAFHAPIAIPSAGLELGRGSVLPGGVTLDDPRLSRRHLRLDRLGAGFRVTDLGSRNGTSLDGRTLAGPTDRPGPGLVCAGGTALLLVDDLRPHRRAPVSVRDGMVLGPALGSAWERLRATARGGEQVHLRGESGSGKELAARAFHAMSPLAQGPFVAVNCATIPPALAERLLFGARRGAYSGADVDAEGFAQAADGGTLFLDEVVELDLPVQAKLLRLIEAREVTPLGAVKARPVKLQICSATHRGLRAEVTAGRFRQDLYYRLGRPEVVLPPLRDRREEIPWLVVRELQAAGGPPADISLAEACLLRPWPGNVRELIHELRHAARAALEAGDPLVEAHHLALNAGERLSTPTPAHGVAVVPRPEGPPPAAQDDATPPPASPRRLPGRAAIEQALRQEEGNVARAARALGVHRTQLRRWLEKEGVDPAAFARPPEG